MSLPVPRSPVDAIQDAYDGLTAQEQAAASFILEHLTDVLVYNSAELSALCDVSQATLSRLYRKLGYRSAADFRQQVRSTRLPGAPELDSGAAPDAQTHTSREVDGVTRTHSRIPDRQVTQLADRLIGARRIAVIGLRNSYPLALHLREQLLQVRQNVHLLPAPGQSVSEEIIDYDARDVAIVVALRRRPPLLRPVVDLLVEQHSDVVIIGDSTARRLASPEVTLFEADLIGGQSLSSYTAAFSLIERLAITTAARAHTLDVTATEHRVDRINAAFDRLNELEPHSRRSTRNERP